MNNQKIGKIDPYPHHYDPYYCTFNLDGEFLLYSEVDNNFNSYDKKIVWIYSAPTKYDKWTCKRIYKIPEAFELISISKYDKLYLFSNHYFYEWNIITEKCVR